MPRVSKKRSTRRVIVDLFHQHPHLLEQKNNDAALEIFHEETGQKITDRIRQYLANVKSDLKKKGLVAVPGTNGTSVPHEAPKAPRSTPVSDLEDAIDHCLADARLLDADGRLKVVIEHLRAARNILIRTSTSH